MSRWFRHYAGMMRDEKLVRVAMASKQSVERVVWIWGAILESAGEINDAGRFELDTAEVAYFLRADEGDIVSVLDTLSALQRVAVNRVVNWGKRQFDSDRSANRQAAYRERKRRNRDNDANSRSGDAGVTAASRHGDVTVTHQILETDTESKKDICAVAKATRTANSDFEEFWKAYPSRGKARNPKHPAQKKFEAAVRQGAPPISIIAGAKRYAAAMLETGKVGTEFVAMAVTWLNQRSWEDGPPAENVVPMAGHYAAFNSPEMDAWVVYERSMGKSYPRDRSGGWRFPSQWPPNHQTGTG